MDGRRFFFPSIFSLQTPLAVDGVGAVGEGDQGVVGVEIFVGAVGVAAIVEIVKGVVVDVEVIVVAVGALALEGDVEHHANRKPPRWMMREISPALAKAPLSLALPQKEKTSRSVPTSLAVLVGPSHRHASES